LPVIPRSAATRDPFSEPWSGSTGSSSSKGVPRFARD